MSARVAVMLLRNGDWRRVPKGAEVFSLCCVLLSSLIHSKKAMS